LGRRRLLFRRDGEEWGRGLEVGFGVRWGGEGRGGGAGRDGMIIAPYGRPRTEGSALALCGICSA